MIHSPALLHLFGRQDGVAAHHQLRQHLSARQLKRAIELELFVHELPKVKRLAGAPTTPASRVMALSLYTAVNGFVSGMTAARQHGVTCVPREYYEVMVPDRMAPELPPWVTATRSSWRLVSDRRELADGRIVSSPLRTLFRCGATCSATRFEKIAEQMWHLHLITPVEADAYLTAVRRQGRSGVARFERWLEHAVARKRPSQSGLEIDLATALEHLPIPKPLRQMPLTLGNAETIHLDLAWPDVRLGVEPGASWWHGGDAAMRRDYQRDRACDELGWRILRFDEVELRDVHRCARQILSIHQSRQCLQKFAG